MERVTIVGMGLIGTSLGLALKKAKLANVEIIGHDKELGVASKAHKRGAVDKTHINLIAAVEGARLIIIATPVMAMRQVLESIAPHLEQQAVVTDTGSTKGTVLQWADQYLPPGVSFVGGHPMAGREQSGPDAADPDLFTGATYAICPSSRASKEAVQSIVGLAETIGARPYFVNPEEHDSYAAAVSHLPILLSTALVTCTSRSPAWQEIEKLASTGYRDLSRLASGDPEMSRDICFTNKDAILYWIDEFIRQLYEYRNLVKAGGDELEKAFIRAWEARARWLAHEPAPTSTSAPMPTASDSMVSLFMGEKLARRMKDLTKRTEGDKTKYRKG
ncbi:MAG: prephenate dehydrogenase/arogenate dehydrogenase family protein [Chloroflexi bacterium]|nr:prephenate dehydrogenase/arogenate dehydrogenase family protein [Chloroflexota bacterium]